MLNKPKISIVGDGGWGTTLAVLLSRKGFNVTLWGFFADYVRLMNKTRKNVKFLPGINIPENIKITHKIEEAILEKDIIILAVPSQYLRDVLNKVKLLDYPKKAIYLSVVKGIEVSTLKRMSEVIEEELGRIKLAVLSGPTIAHEVVNNIPTTAVVGSKDKKVRKYLQNIFMGSRFRVYTNDDVVGVELGGSLKNVIAIACGISDGLGFGTNAKAAILSRGLVEMARLGRAMGARQTTFSGITGLGDLVTTCISQYSRNRFVGMQIGKGKKLSYVQSHMQMVAEGIPTAKSAYALSLKYKIEMPITREIYNVLYKNKIPIRAVEDLMGRKGKEE